MIYRWIAAALLLLNVGLFMWIRWYADSPAEDEVPPQPRETVAPGKVKMLHEPGVRPVLRATPQPVAPAPTIDSPVLACFRLGSFASVELADKAAARLTERKIGFERSEEERRTISGYRILVPPLPSRQAAEAKRAELTRLGFRDHAIVADEGQRNAISLGIYSVEENARRHLTRLQAKGIKADIHTQYQIRTAYWLDVRAPDNELDWLRKSEWGTPEIRLAPEPCPSAVPTPSTERDAPATPPAGT